MRVSFVTILLMVSTTRGSRCSVIGTLSGDMIPVEGSETGNCLVSSTAIATGMSDEPNAPMFSMPIETEYEDWNIEA